MSISSKGKSIRLFLVDGDPQGILTAEIGNWTGHVLAAPRSKIVELLQRSEMDKTGIYFLTGVDAEGSGLSKVYVGESDNVGRRLAQHNRDETKDFWEKVCVVTSKDMNLTKAHVKYLESSLISIIQKSGGIMLVNGNAPIFDFLPEADCADMEDFLNKLRLILPVLGLGFLHSQPKITKNNGQVKRDEEISDSDSTSPVFEINSRKLNIKAKAQEIDGQFIVLAGSDARLKWKGSDNHSYVNLFNQLSSLGKITISDDSKKRTFTEDMPFNSPSAAAAVVFGRASNGRTAWKMSGGKKTYEDWQNDRLEKMTLKGLG